MARKKVKDADPSTPPTESTDSPSGKARGFQKGNKHGKGNPFGTQAAQLRAYLFGNISKGQWDAVHAALIEKAMEGSIAHLQLLYQYTFGKPAQSIDVNMTASTISKEEAEARVKAFFGIEDKK